MADERTVTLPGVWAEDANTVIPAPPIPGQAYRNPAVSAADFSRGQRYSQVADSAEWNQMHYLMTAMLQQAEQYGVMPYSVLTNYKADGICLGTDGILYQALQDNGPNAPGGIQPVSNSEYWVNTISVELPLAGAATETTDGDTAGIVTLAADSDSTSRDKAATPASVQARLGNITTRSSFALMNAASLPIETRVKCTFSGTKYNDDNAFNVVDGTYTIPETGRYLFTGILETTVAVSSHIYIYLYVNGVEHTLIMHGISVSGITGTGLSISAVDNFSQGDILEFYAFSNNNNGISDNSQIQISSML